MNIRMINAIGINNINHAIEPSRLQIILTGYIDGNRSNRHPIHLPTIYILTDSFHHKSIQLNDKAILFKQRYKLPR